jgi:hypothetical protein
MELYLVIGPSKSGKTTIAKSILESRDKPIFCVADRTGELGERYQACSWDAVKTLSGCCCLVDDLIATSQSQFVSLQNLLCFAASHTDVCPVVICTHIVVKNNISALLSAVHTIIFTADKANISSLSTVLSHFKFDKAVKKEIEDRFLSSNRSYGRFILEVKKRTAAWAEDGTPGLALAPTSDGGETLKEELTPHISAARLLARAADPDGAMLLYDLIYPRLPAEIKDSDYCLHLKSPSRGEVVINFVDFLYMCVEGDGERPSVEMRSFFKYLQTFVTVPKRLIVNPHMQ